MHRKNKKDSKIHFIINVLFIIAFLMASCSSASANRYTTPSEYYLYTPKDYTPDEFWPLFIGIHGQGGSGKDCWNTWQPYADKNGFILLCPSLADAGGGWMLTDGEQKLNAILGEVLPNYSIKSKYYMAGFSAGASFIQGYAYDFPNQIAGLSVISSGNFFPQVNPALGSTPFLITVGANDTNLVSPAQNYYNSLVNRGFNASFHIIDNTGHQISREAIDMTIQQFAAIYGAP